MLKDKNNFILVNLLEACVNVEFEMCVRHRVRNQETGQIISDYNIEYR